jgi:hypothetical protein
MLLIADFFLFAIVRFMACPSTEYHMYQLLCVLMHAAAQKADTSSQL